MNFPGLVLFIGLLVAVELTVFSWASHEKPENSKDDDFIANDRSQQEGHRRLLKTLKKCFSTFYVNGKQPTFPVGNTVPICGIKGFFTLFDDKFGIPLYSAYKVDPKEAQNIGNIVERKICECWHPTEGNQIKLQGSDKMYGNQPGPVKYQRGHMAPFNMLSYSLESGYASFAYTNAVPQVAGFNQGPWKTYEGRIVKYAKEQCAPQGGTMYLITGISEIRLSQEKVGAPVLAKRKVMAQTFPSHVPSITNKIAIPSSMWTVFCCVEAGQVLGAFAVLGNNLPKPNILIQPNLGVTKAEELIRVGAGLAADDTNIKLFPGNADCYAPDKQVNL